VRGARRRIREAVEGIKAAKPRASRCAPTPPSTKRRTCARSKSCSSTPPVPCGRPPDCAGYGYSAVDDREIFLTRDDIHEKFKDFERLARKYPVHQTPMYVEFLKGARELPCTAWATRPTT